MRRAATLARRRLPEITRLGIAVAATALTLGMNAGVIGAAPTSEAVAVIELVNAERGARNLPHLTLSDALATSAEQYAASMAAANFFSHTGADGSTITQRGEAAGYVGWTFLGENLAAGQTTPERVVAGWMSSPSHRANVLSPLAVEIGIGYSYQAETKYGHYWVTEFGARDPPAEAEATDIGGSA
jgi:uncharacterized protein YkwD